MRRSAKLFMPAAMLLALVCWSGCAPSLIPKEIRSGVDSGLTFKEVLKEPDSYLGKRILWGGQIIGAQYAKEGTYLVILQLPADSKGKPRPKAVTEGRFIAFADRPLDEAIYREGTQISVVGLVSGQRQLPLVGGFLDYIYPLVTAEHIYWWPKK